MNVKEDAGCACHVFCGTFPRALWEVVDRAKGEDITWPCHRIHNNCQQVLAQPETVPVPIVELSVLLILQQVLVQLV